MHPLVSVLALLGGLLLLPGLCFWAFRSLWGPNLGLLMISIAITLIAAAILVRIFGKRE